MILVKEDVQNCKIFLENIFVAFLGKTSLENNIKNDQEKKSRTVFIRLIWLCRMVQRFIAYVLPVSLFDYKGFWREIKMTTQGR